MKPKQKPIDSMKPKQKPEGLTLDEIVARLRQIAGGREITLYWQNQNALGDGGGLATLVSTGAIIARWTSKLFHPPVYDGVTPRGPSVYFLEEEPQSKRKPKPGAVIAWSASNKKGFVSLKHSEKTFREALIAARAFVKGELYGDGAFTIYVDGYAARRDVISPSTGGRWVTRSLTE